MGDMNWTPHVPPPSWLDADRRPPGATDETVEALGKLGEAVEHLERARGHLYSFHQLCGTVDRQLGEAAELLRSADQEELAASLEQHLIGRNVLDGRWSFQIVEEYDATYWSQVIAFAEFARDHLVDGARHVYESEMKDRRRSAGEPHHDRRP